MSQGMYDKPIEVGTVLHKIYSHDLRFVGYCSVLLPVDLPISFRITSLALQQSQDWPSASEVTLKNIGKSITQIPLELMLYYHKTKYNRTVYITQMLFIKVLYFHKSSNIYICLQ